MMIMMMLLCHVFLTDFCSPIEWSDPQKTRHSLQIDRKQWLRLQIGLITKKKNEHSQGRIECASGNVGLCKMPNFPPLITPKWTTERSSFDANWKWNRPIKSHRTGFGVLKVRCYKIPLMWFDNQIRMTMQTMPMTNADEFLKELKETTFRVFVTTKYALLEVTLCKTIQDNRSVSLLPCWQGTTIPSKKQTDVWM